MKVRAIELFCVVVILFVTAFLVVGCDEEAEGGYVMSEIHFWCEPCQKEIVGPTIAPVCFFTCNTCSTMYRVGKYVTVMDDGTYSYKSRICELGTLPPGESKEVTIDMFPNEPNIILNAQLPDPNDYILTELVVVVEELQVRVEKLEEELEDRMRWEKAAFIWE